MAELPKMFPFLQEKFTVIPGTLDDVFVMTLAGRDRWLHGTEEGKKAECTVMWEACSMRRLWY